MLIFNILDLFHNFVKQTTKKLEKKQDTFNYKLI